jgi:cell fate (sporulation/competence/biofilm development) regulator YlbF (YheA/YmcA/DUF963 family)
MANIYDTANQMEREIREMQQYKDLKAAKEAIATKPESQKLFAEFQEVQFSLQQKMQAGEMPNEDDQAKIQDISKRVQDDSLITVLLEKEQAFSIIMNDINKIIMGPIEEIYAK